MNNTELDASQVKALRKYKIFFAILFAVCLGLVIFTGNYEVNRRSDAKLEERMSRIAGDIADIEFKDNYQALPENINGITTQSLEGVEYKKKTSTDYELCATFKTAHESSYASSIKEPSISIYASHHDKGRHCFTGRLKFTKPASSTYTPSITYADPNSSQKAEVDYSTNEQVVICGKKGQAYSGQVGTIDQPQKRIYQFGASTSSTNFTRYDNQTIFVDKQCKPITIANLKTGDSVQFVATKRNGHTFADAIQKVE